MKKSLGFVLVYFGCQILGAIVGMICCVIYLLATKQTLDMENVQSMSLAPALFLGIVFMALFLGLTNHISKEKVTWSPVSPKYLVLAVILYVSFILLIDFLLSHMSWLPNIMEDTFDVLQSGWLGILCIALLGPILEELLFRGAITKELLKKYSPTKAIIFSALIFGIFHINPIQVVSATLIGLVLGWIYYKTASLIPCILLHVVNNSLSVYLNLKFPDVESTADLWGNNTYYYLMLGGAAVIFVVVLLLMKRTTVPYNWKETESIEG